MDAVLFVKLELSGGDEFLFSTASEFIEFDAIPSLEGVSVSSAVLDPGRSIGQRETVTARFEDHRWRFASEDYDAGTFWTKFRAIYPTIQGSRLLVYRGDRGQTLAEMERRTYIVDSLKISKGGASITAKDPLTLVLGKSAQAPIATTGELLAAIDENDASFTLTPTGIGNLQYPASGRGCIGGSEVLSYTRSGDAVTLVNRGENLGGVGETHEAGSKFQVVLEYVNRSPSYIVNHLLTNYTDVDPSWITLSDWQIVDDHVTNLYDAQVTAPESVTKLLDEISEQFGVTLYWDAVAEKLRFISLAPTGSGQLLSDDMYVEGSFDISEQPDKRVSQPWIYYAQRNAAEPLDDEKNFRRILVEVADNESDYEQSAIKKVHSRWIDITNQVAASRLADMLLARYKIPPRLFKFDLWRSPTAVLPTLGSGVMVSHHRLVDEDGLPVSIPAVVVSESGEIDRVSFEAEEINYDGTADTTKYVVIDSSSLSTINLRTLFESLYSSPGLTDVVTFVVQSGASIEGPPFSYTITVGSWPVGVTLNLIVNGSIVGRSFYQDYGGGFEASSPGWAIVTTRAINIENNGSIIGMSQGGASGIAIDGWSFVTYTGSGELTGSTVG